MSKSMIYAVIIFACIVLSGSLAMAVSSTDETEAEGEAAVEMQSDEEMAERETEGDMHGVVVAVNKAGSSIVIKEDRYNFEMHSFEVTDSTSFSGAGDLSEVGVGDKVMIDYYDMNGKHIADSIDVEDASGEASTAPKEEGLQKALVDKGSE
jgi:hypothetical protein